MSPAASLLLLPDNVLNKVARNFGKDCSPFSWATITFCSRDLRTNFVFLLESVIRRYPIQYATAVTTLYKEDAIPLLKKYINEIAFFTFDHGYMQPREFVRAAIIHHVSVELKNVVLVEWVLANMPSPRFSSKELARLFKTGYKELIAPIRKFFTTNVLNLFLMDYSYHHPQPISLMSMDDRIHTVGTMMRLHGQDERARRLMCWFFGIDQKGMMEYLRAGSNYFLVWPSIIFYVLEAHVSIVRVKYWYVTLRFDPVKDGTKCLYMDLELKMSLPSLLLLATHKCFQPITNDIAEKFCKLCSEGRHTGLVYLLKKLREYGKAPLWTEERRLRSRKKEPFCMKSFMDVAWKYQPKFLRAKYPIPEFL